MMLTKNRIEWIFSFWVVGSALLNGIVIHQSFISTKPYHTLSCISMIMLAVYFVWSMKELFGKIENVGYTRGMLEGYDKGFDTGKKFVKACKGELHKGELQ